MEEAALSTRRADAAQAPGTAAPAGRAGSTGPAGSVDLAPFRPGRLGDGHPIEPPNPYSDD